MTRMKIEDIYTFLSRFNSSSSNDVERSRITLEQTKIESKNKVLKTVLTKGVPWLIALGTGIAWLVKTFFSK